MPFFSRRSSTGFHGLPGPDAFGGSPGLMWPRPVWKSTRASRAFRWRGGRRDDERAVKF